MFHIIDYTYEDIQAMRRAARELDILQYSVVLDETTIAECQRQRAEIIDEITEWEGLPF